MSVASGSEQVVVSVASGSGWQVAVSVASGSGWQVAASVALASQTADTASRVLRCSAIPVTDVRTQTSLMDQQQQQQHCIKNECHIGLDAH